MHINIRMKIKHAATPFTYTLCAQTGSLKKKHMESLPNQHFDPHPPPFGVVFSLFRNFAADKNEYSGLGIPENKFSGRAHAENK